MTSDDKSEPAKSGQPIMLDLVGNWQLVINNYSKAWSSIKMSPKGRALLLGAIVLIGMKYEL